MNIISTTPTVRAVTVDDGLRVELSGGADAMLEPAQARALAAKLLEAADVADTTPSDNAGYTAYAKSLCPDWCTDPHNVMTDDRDFPAVIHECTVGVADILNIGRWDPTPDTIEVRVQRYDNLNSTRPSVGATVHMYGYIEDNPFRPEDAAQVSLLLLKAAEIARESCA